MDQQTECRYHWQGSLPGLLTLFSVTLAQLVKGQVHDLPKKFTEWRDDISEVYILEGLPTFEKGQERKGEIAY
jgi:hypothetical protein